jgi:hypothetical protein
MFQTYVITKSSWLKFHTPRKTITESECTEQPSSQGQKILTRKGK